MSLIHDQEIESGCPCLVCAAWVASQEFGSAENELAVQERVGVIVIALNGKATFLIEEGKEEIESAEKLYKPLVNQWFGHENENPVRAAS
jgi:hypothetical protein